jgi:hypothetical protein
MKLCFRIVSVLWIRKRTVPSSLVSTGLLNSDSVRSFETSETLNTTTQRNILEGLDFQQLRCEKPSCRMTAILRGVSAYTNK